jgi:hypothetical protein
MKTTKTLITFLLLAFLLASCKFPTKVPTLVPVTPVPPTATAAGLTDYSSGAYLDDRSTAAALVLSYVNAINSHHFVRAYSYWDAPETVIGTLDAFTTATEGIANEIVTLGQVSSDGAAGSIYYTVPAAVTDTLSGGGTNKYSACFVLRLPQPGNYGAPPITPMHITSNTVITPVATSTSDASILSSACTGLAGSPAGDPALEDLTDISAANYIDNRSEAVDVVKSLVNSINRHELVRAYSYYEAPSIFPGSYSFYESGMASTDTITSVIFGTVISDAGAGQYYYQVPVAEYITETDASEHLYIGCYNLHLSNPSFQGELPFRPMAITTETLTEYLITVDVAPILETACAPYPTSTPHPTATFTPMPAKADACNQYTTYTTCSVHKDVCQWNRLTSVCSKLP